MPRRSCGASGVYLRPAEMRDFEEWAALRDSSRTFLSAWEPVWPSDDLTRAAFRRRLRLHAEEMSRDEAYPFLVFREDEVMVGGLTIGQIRRGVAQTATLGYWMGEAYAGRGYMSRAVRAAADFVFSTLRLHRLEAACLPHNEASMRLLESVGFQRRGLCARPICASTAGGRTISSSRSSRAIRSWPRCGRSTEADTPFAGSLPTGRCRGGSGRPGRWRACGAQPNVLDAAIGS